MISQFVKDIFFPEKIGSYYPFSKYIVGIEINKANIIATKICLQGRKTIIESILEEKFEAETTPELEDEEIIDPLTKALQTIFSKIVRVFLKYNATRPKGKTSTASKPTSINLL